MLRSLVPTAYVEPRKAPWATLAVLATLVVGFALATPTAQAVSTGINNFSGQTGNFCSVCHNTGTVPVVTLDGPTFVAPGTVSTYTLTIEVPSTTTTNQRAGGLGVSTNGGTMIVTDAGTRIHFGDLTHNTPRSMDLDRNVVFTFDWEAPVSTGDFTIFAAGNAVNLDSNTLGDAAAATTLTVSVGAPTSTPGEISGETLSPLTVASHDPQTGEMTLDFEAGCDTTQSAIYYGPLGDVATYGYSGEVCDTGTDGTFSGFNPGSGSFFFLVVGGNGSDEGSYGLDRQGISRSERVPFSANLCGTVQALGDRCDAVD